MSGGGVSVVGNVQADVLVGPVDAMPAPGTDVLVEDIAARAAGSAGNTALVLRDLATDVRLYGVIGDDGFGAMVRAELDTHRLADDLRVVTGGRTGISVCLEAPGRDRAFWTYWGCLTEQRADEVPTWASAAEYGVYCGYFTLPAARGSGTVELLERAHGTTLLDCGWDIEGFTDPATIEEMASVLAVTDVFLPNASEAVALAGVPDPAEATRLLQRRYGGWVATKLGADGGCAAGPRGAWHAAAAPRVQVSDTTGAGDAFNAGLVHALTTGASWSDALTTAVTVASEIVTRPSHRRFPVRQQDGFDVRS